MIKLQCVFFHSWILCYTVECVKTRAHSVFISIYAIRVNRKQHHCMDSMPSSLFIDLLTFLPNGHNSLYFQTNEIIININFRCLNNNVPWKTAIAKPNASTIHVYLLRKYSPLASIYEFFVRSLLSNPVSHTFTTYCCENAFFFTKIWSKHNIC